MEIGGSARRHGCSDEDILHAYRHAIYLYDEDDMRMVVGPDRAGKLLEIGVSTRGAMPVIVHAMPARRKWLR